VIADVTHFLVGCGKDTCPISIGLLNNMDIMPNELKKSCVVKYGDGDLGLNDEIERSLNDDTASGPVTEGTTSSFSAQAVQVFNDGVQLSISLIRWRCAEQPTDERDLSSKCHRPQ
jgi:hypothetical protein